MTWCVFMVEWVPKKRKRKKRKLVLATHILSMRRLHLADFLIAFLLEPQTMTKHLNSNRTHTHTQRPCRNEAKSLYWWMCGPIAYHIIVVWSSENGKWLNPRSNNTQAETEEWRFKINFESKKTWKTNIRRFTAGAMLNHVECDVIVWPTAEDVIAFLMLISCLSPLFSNIETGDKRQHGPMQRI